MSPAQSTQPFLFAGGTSEEPSEILRFAQNDSLGVFDQ